MVPSVLMYTAMVDVGVLMWVFVLYMLSNSRSVDSYTSSCRASTAAKAASTVRSAENLHFEDALLVCHRHLGPG